MLRHVWPHSSEKAVVLSDTLWPDCSYQAPAGVACQFCKFGCVGACVEDGQVGAAVGL